MQCECNAIIRDVKKSPLHISQQDHFRECEELQNKSPLFKIVENYKKQQLTEAQIRILLAEIMHYKKAVNDEIQLKRNQNPLERTQPPLPSDFIERKKKNAQPGVDFPPFNNFGNLPPKQDSDNQPNDFNANFFRQGHNQKDLSGLEEMNLLDTNPIPISNHLKIKEKSNFNPSHQQFADNQKKFQNEEEEKKENYISGSSNKENFPIINHSHQNDSIIIEIQLPSENVPKNKVSSMSFEEEVPAEENGHENLNSDKIYKPEDILNRSDVIESGIDNQLDNYPKLKKPSKGSIFSEESKGSFSNGSKLSQNDVNIYCNPRKLLEELENSYDGNNISNSDPCILKKYQIFDNVMSKDKEMIAMDCGHKCDRNRAREYINYLFNIKSDIKFACPECKVPITKQLLLRIINKEEENIYKELLIEKKPERKCCSPNHSNQSSDKSIVRLACDHDLCRGCGLEIIQNSQNSDQQVRFPCPSCGKYCSSRDVKAIVGDDLWEWVYKDSISNDLNQSLIPSNCHQCNKIVTSGGVNLECHHIWHRECIKKRFDNYFSKQKDLTGFRAPCCQMNVSVNMLKKIISEKKYNLLEEELMQEFLGGLQASCSKCNYTFLLEKGKLEGLPKDVQNNYSPDQLQCYVTYRFTCPTCQLSQCAKCKRTPYHDKMTCEEMEEKEKSKTCRYCDQIIQIINYDDPPAYQDICQNEECKTKKINASNLMLPCGHPNCGAGEDLVPCLYLDQNKKPCQNKVDGEGYCSICFTEALRAAPCVQLKCGHVYHYHCMQDIIKTRWATANINFSYLTCSTCKGTLGLSEKNPLYPLLNKHIQYMKNLHEKMLDRLKREGRDQDEKVVSGEYKGKPIEYAMKIFRYHECSECKNPFFAGLKACGDGQDQMNKEDKYVCYECAYQGDAVIDCNKHGKEFIVFKCKFCCSIASWFCWGTTHFCEPCHAKQVKGDYVSNKKPHELPQCGDKSNCPLKIDHKPNGTEELSLGCTMCKNEAYEKNQYTNNIICNNKTKNYIFQVSRCLNIFFDKISIKNCKNSFQIIFLQN